MRPFSTTRVDVGLLWVAALLLAAWALPAAAVDPGDLDIPSSRLPRWAPATEAELGHQEAQGWVQYDATCECAGDACVEGTPGVSCTPAPGTRAFPSSWGCSPANPADNGGDDGTLIDCLLDAAPERSVVYVPRGMYDIQNHMLSISRSHLVLRCEDPSNTHLRATRLAASGTTLVDGTACDDDGPGGIVGSARNTCAALVLSVGARGWRGSAVGWNAGYDTFSTNVSLACGGDCTSRGFSVGGWIELDLDDCPPLLDNANGPEDRSFTHIDRITAINGNSVTLERGLLMDYDDYGCQGGANATPLYPTKQVGVESCHFTTHTSLARENMGNFPPVTFGGSTVESWAVGNHMQRFEDAIFHFKYAARNWVQGNRFEEYCRTGDSSDTYNTEAVNFHVGAGWNVVENNYFFDQCVASKIENGAEGNVLAYNFVRRGDDAGTRPIDGKPERSFFNHGNYSRAQLFEGNDLDVKMDLGDTYWGRNGPYITAFRNRMHGPDKTNIGTEITTGSHPPASLVNVIGNVSDYFYTWPGGVGGDPPGSDLSASRDIDGNSESGQIVEQMWLEKNRFLNTNTCKGDTTPNRCGFHMDTPAPGTMCGTGAPGDCEGGTGDNLGGNSPPVAWAQDQVPHSLYRTTAPSWWCQEACAWDDVHNGIGAWGDDFNSTLCKLPAQIQWEGGTCTPVGSAPPPPTGPPAPYLLPD